MNRYQLGIAGYGIAETIDMTADDHNISDNDIVESILGGKKKSYKILVDRHQRNAYSFARGMVGNHEDAYDLSQEAFVRAYNNLNWFNPVYPFRIWFYKILSRM